MKGVNIQFLQKAIGYQFKEENLLNQALTHKSAHHQNNERLEFLGDSILNFAIASKLFSKFPQASEGELTRARASLVNQQTLAEIALEFKVGDYLSLGLGELKSGGFRRSSILADGVEAIIGAIYLDSDVETCTRCIHAWYEDRLSKIEPQSQSKDPKTRLQEHLQASQHILPEYSIVSLEGEPHAQCFTVACQVQGVNQTVTGKGSSRRYAEQEAAVKMLEVILGDID